MTLDLLTTLSDAGIQRLHEGPKEISGACPMHEERTGHPDHHPSWSINKFSYLHFCQACQYKGTLTSLLVDILGSAPEDLEQDLKQQSFLRTMADVRAAPTQVLERCRPDPHRVVVEVHARRPATQAAGVPPVATGGDSHL